MLRARDPDPAEVIELAGTPTAWGRGQDTLLVEYSQMHRYDWPNGGAVTSVLGAGDLLGEFEVIEGMPQRTPGNVAVLPVDCRVIPGDEFMADS